MEISWLIIAGLIILAVVLVWKTQDVLFIFAIMKKYFFTFLFFGIILFLVFSIYHVTINNELSFTSKEGVFSAFKVYFVWLKSFFSNVAGITGYASGQDWTLTNSTAG